MGKKRKDNGYNRGKFKEFEYFLKGLRAPFYKLLNYKSNYQYDCPICGYSGPFMDKKDRLRAKCPKCGEPKNSGNLYSLPEYGVICGNCLKLKGK